MSRLGGAALAGPGGPDSLDSALARAFVDGLRVALADSEGALTESGAQREAEGLSCVVRECIGDSLLLVLATGARWAHARCPL